MQNQVIEIDAETAKENLANAISRLERAISAQRKRMSNIEQTRTQVVKELDTYITNLEILLNPNKK